MYKFSRQYLKLNSIFETNKTQVFSQTDVVRQPKPKLRKKKYQTI